MNTTSSAGVFWKSDKETVFPLVSGKRKSGALVPSGNIVELTATMKGLCGKSRELSNGKGLVDCGGKRSATPLSDRSKSNICCRLNGKIQWCQNQMWVTTFEKGRDHRSIRHSFCSFCVTLGLPACIGCWRCVKGCSYAKENSAG